MHDKSNNKISKLNCKRKKGFSLVEMLVTIAVISILSGTVTISIAMARKRAIDADIISGANSLMQNAQVTTRGNLKYGVWFTGANNLMFGGFYYNISDCDGMFLGASDASQARDICKKILEKNKNATTFISGQGPLYIGSLINGIRILSIMVYLPGKDRMYCIGSNGRSSSESYKDGRGCGNNSAGSWRCPGCGYDLSM